MSPSVFVFLKSCEDKIAGHFSEAPVELILQERSIVIATYALCGFSNITSIGVMIGVLSSLAPSRKKDIIRVVVWAMVTGSVACFMTACIAGWKHCQPDTFTFIPFMKFQFDYVYSC